MPQPASSRLPETEVEPDPKLERRTRRVFTGEYKLRVIAEADQCRHGELSELLRREKIYHGQLQSWRRELADGGEQALSKSAPGPRPRLSPEQKQIEKLQRENTRLSRKLEIAEGCVELQKKLSRLIEQSNSGSDS